MVNKTSIMEYIRQDSYRPLSFEDLMIVFQVEAEEQWKFARVLGSLEKQGEIVKTRKNKYGLPEKMNLAKGVINLSQRGDGSISGSPVTMAGPMPMIRDASIWKLRFPE